MGGGGGGSPAGSAGCVQLYGTSTTFACDATFLDVAASHLVEIGGAPVTPFAGLFVGPDESTLPALLQGYAGDAGALFTRVAPLDPSSIGVGFELQSTTGVYIATNSVYGVQVDVYAKNGDGYIEGYRSYIDRNGFTVPDAVGFFGAQPNVAGNFYQFYSSDLGGVGIANPYYLWFGSTGVYRVREDSTFNSVGQAIAALYNPQFTTYTPGSADFERCIPGCQWESNVAVITTEKGGTGTLRDMQLGDAGVHVLVSDLKTTGAATGKTVVCVDTSTGRLYASSSGVACAN